MQSIKEMSKELDSKFKNVRGKLAFSLLMCVALIFSSYIVFMMVSFLSIKIIPLSISGIVSFILMVIFYSTIFLFCYGFSILNLRLQRQQNVSLGYLFLGFRQKKQISAVVNVFAILFFLCIMISSYPLMKKINVQDQDVLQKLLENTQELQRLANYTVLLFLVVFLLFFLRFVFSWIVIYDNPKVPGILSLAKSSSLLRGRLLKFLGFELFSCKFLILIFAATYLVNYGLTFVELGKFSSIVYYLISLVRIISLFLIILKINFSISFFYDKIFSSSLNKANTDEASILINDSSNTENQSTKDE